MKEQKRRKSNSFQSGVTCERSESKFSRCPASDNWFYCSNKPLNEEKHNQGSARTTVIEFAKERVRWRLQAFLNLWDTSFCLTKGALVLYDTKLHVGLVNWYVLKTLMSALDPGCQTFCWFQLYNKFRLVVISHQVALKSSYIFHPTMHLILLCIDWKLNFFSLPAQVMTSKYNESWFNEVMDLLIRAWWMISRFRGFGSKKEGQILWKCAIFAVIWCLWWEHYCNFRSQSFLENLVWIKLCFLLLSGFLLLECL